MSGFRYNSTVIKNLTEAPVTQDPEMRRLLEPIHKAIFQLAGRTQTTTVTETTPSIPVDYPAAVLADNPLGYWRLEELAGNFLDSMPGARHATPGGAIAARGVTGVISQGLAAENTGLPAVNPAIGLIPYSAALSFGAGSFTVEFWFRRVGNPNNGIMAAKYTEGTSWPEWNINLASSNQITVEYRTSNTSTPTYSYTATFAGANINDGQRHHIVVVRNGNTDVRVFLDGVVSVGSAFTGTLWSSTQQTGIGGFPSSISASAPTGAYDEYALYNFALSDARVLVHYSQRAPTPGVSGQVTTPLQNGLRWQQAGTLVANYNEIVTVNFVSGATLAKVGNRLDVTVSGGSSVLTPDSVPTSPNAADDEFDLTTFDTAGTRRPGATPWAWFNQGTATININRGYGVIVPPFTGSNNQRIIEQALPASGAWVYRCKIMAQIPATNNFGAMIIRNSVNGRIIGLLLINNGGTIIAISRFNSVTSFNSTVTSTTTAEIPRRFLYLEIAFNGTTTYTFRFSWTGQDNDFDTLGTDTVAAFITNPADRIGMAVDPQTNAGACRIVFDWFRRIS